MAATYRRTNLTVRQLAVSGVSTPAAGPRSSKRSPQGWPRNGRSVTSRYNSVIRRANVDGRSTEISSTMTGLHAEITTGDTIPVLRNVLRALSGFSNEWPIAASSTSSASMFQWQFGNDVQMHGQSVRVIGWCRRRKPRETHRSDDEQSLSEPVSTMPIWSGFLTPILEVLADGEVWRKCELVTAVCGQIGITEAQRAEVLPS